MARTVRTRKRGKTWSYAFEVGTSTKRKTIEKGGFETKKQAYEQGVIAMNKHLHGGLNTNQTGLTVKDYLENYLKIIGGNIKDHTKQCYKNSIRMLNNHIGVYKLVDLKPRHIDNMIKELAKNYTKNTVAGVKGFLNSALQYAVFPAELIIANPATGIKLPANIKGKVIDRRVVTPQEFNNLLDHFPLGNRFRMPVLIAYHTGMRIAEVFGLQWSDIDFDKHELKVVRQLQELQSIYKLVPPKTPASVRTISLDNYIIAELLKWQEYQNAHRKYYISYEDGRLIASTNPKEPIDLICTTAEGRFFTRKCLREELHKLGTNAHSLRHTHATLLIENGATPKEVAARLGHSSTLITQDIYTHITQGMITATATRFESILSAQNHSADKSPTTKSQTPS